MLGSIHPCFDNDLVDSIARVLGDGHTLNLAQNGPNRPAPPPSQEIWAVSQISRGIWGPPRGIPREICLISREIPWKSPGISDAPSAFPGISREIRRGIHRMSFPGGFPGAHYPAEPSSGEFRLGGQAALPHFPGNFPGNGGIFPVIYEPAHPVLVGYAILTLRCCYPGSVFTIVEIWKRLR